MNESYGCLYLTIFSWSWNYIEQMKPIKSPVTLVKPLLTVMQLLKHCYGAVMLLTVVYSVIRPGLPVQPFTGFKSLRPAWENLQISLSYFYFLNKTHFWYNLKKFALKIDMICIQKVLPKFDSIFYHKKKTCLRNKFFRNIVIYFDIFRLGTFSPYKKTWEIF